MRARTSDETVSDEDAYRRYFGGDEHAAALLVERYGDSLTLYLNSYLRDLHESEDLMIEAFSRLFVKERPIRGEGHFKAYLYKTGRHLALRHLERGRLPLLHLDDLDFEPPGDVAADEGLFRDERHRQLYCAMRQLKEEYREALYLVYFEDMRYREAARVMGKTERQVTKLVHRGKLRLRELLDGG